VSGSAIRGVVCEFVDGCCKIINFRGGGPHLRDGSVCVGRGIGGYQGGGPGMGETV